MPPGEICTKKAENKKKVNEMTEEIITIDQENIPSTPQKNAQESRQSRKRPHPPTEESKSNRVNLVINCSVSPIPASDFGRRGYYRARNGQILQKRYKIDKLLGSGAFSSVHKAEDQTTKNTVAVKIIRSENRFSDSADKEIEFMKTAEKQTLGLGSSSDSGSDSEPSIGSNNVIRMLDNFEIKGSHGIHTVLVFEMLGTDLFGVLFNSNHKVLHLHRIRRFSKDILNGLDFLHSKCKIMHLDLKPENLLVTIDPENMDLADPNCSASLKIGDFGLSAYSYMNVKRTVQTCNYRAPEAHLNVEITPSADIWSFGCTLYEMVTRDTLFPCNGRENCKKKWHFERISELLGPIRRKYFERDERDKEKLEEVFGEKKVFNKDPAARNKISFKELRMRNAYVFAPAQALSEFLTKVLKIDPKKRLSARDALKDPFLSEEKCPVVD